MFEINLNKDSVVNKSSNWVEELKSSLNSKEKVEQFFNQPLPYVSYPVFIPRRVAKKIKGQGLNGPLGNQFLPKSDESNWEIQKNGLYDPIGDQENYKTNQIIHRYKNRVLLTPTTICPIQCRYCFRKNELHENDNIFRKNFSNSLDYLKSNSEIEEVILTGGDPLTLKSKDILDIAIKVNEIEHIKYFRVHSRYASILPSRFDKELINVFNLIDQMYDQFTIVTHINHVSEFDREVEEAFLKLKNFHHLTQSVLLKGINDNPISLKKLFLKISSCNARAYYLHHPDKVRGGMHFYLSTEEGYSIFNKLRDITPGWAIPTYIIDNPKGKRPVGEYL